MKNNNGWLTLFVVALASATLSRTFIFRLVNGEFYLGILFVLVLFLPKLLEWIWHLPLRPIDLTISCDPLKPSPSLFLFKITLLVYPPCKFLPFCSIFSSLGALSFQFLSFVFIG